MTPEQQVLAAGQRAENKVFSALAKLSLPWLSFHTVEWRLVHKNVGERIGEADVVVFHPARGLLIVEIKAGAVTVRDGVWYYASGLPMKQSPFNQARRNRFAITEKLEKRLSKNEVSNLAITHAVWFPEIQWLGALPGTDAPDKAFVLDSTTLLDPEAALIKLWASAAPKAVVWSAAQQRVLKEILAPDCHLFIPLTHTLNDTNEQLHQATQEQVHALRLLRSQSRLLVEGGAGSGKTALAVALAKEHASQGKAVLLTCFNKNLAQLLALSLSNTPQASVFYFHELVETWVKAAGMDFIVPTDRQQQTLFYNEECPDLLLSASERVGRKFDTIIVDEAMDFLPVWWLALESLGSAQFSWYCFFDKGQTIFHHGSVWERPFPAIPLQLETNLRNTRPIGELAATLGEVPQPAEFRVVEGLPPTIQYSQDFGQMAMQLESLLKSLLGKDKLPEERIVVLAPYRHTNATSVWASRLSGFALSTQLATPEPGRLRIGTIQGFKGLEADVVIVVGIDQHANQHPEWLYVGCSRARALLYILALEGVGLGLGNIRP